MMTPCFSPFSSFMDRRQAHWFASGQSEMHTYTLKRGGEIAGDVNAAVLPWLENHAAQDNYFLHINYWDPHRNYRMPMEWFEKTRQMPRHTPDWPDQDAIDNMKDNWGPFSANRLFHRGKSPIPSMPDAIRTVADWRHMCDGYDAAILYMDWHIGQVLEVLERKGVLQDTAFIVSADHADDMGEHGVFGDHVCASEAVHRLPMIVKWPGVTSARECDAMIYHLDVGPTLCEMLGFPVPAGWDGRSFAPLLRSEAGEGYRRRDHLVMTHGLYSCQRVVRTEDWALFRTYHPGLFPFERLALYDMVENQRQTTNVAPRHDDVVCRLDSLLNEWLADQIGKPGSDPDPLQEVVRAGPWKYAQPDNWFRLLENDGLKEQADVIRKRLGVT